ncbi:hypothetical protein [uncultured Dysgonomonas sp.]|uniref:hypothetical protein n=1 Tax=uncultured Dysgonomonas sp. TaxID=206096 RepID=UPI00260716D4|nr:hypothetical protein [uncultured Dysgonomonas sp.]
MRQKYCFSYVKATQSKGLTLQLQAFYRLPYRLILLSSAEGYSGDCQREQKIEEFILYSEAGADLQNQETVPGQ